MKSLMLSGVMLVLMAGVLCIETGTAQQPGVEKPPVAVPVAVKREVHIYPLKHTAATEVAAVLNDVFRSDRGRGGPLAAAAAERETRIAVDARSNAIIVLGTSADIESIEKLIKALDVERPDADARQQVHVIHLMHTTPDDDLQKALGVVFQGQHAKFAVDPLRRLVVLSGDQQTIETAKRVLDRLDAAALQDAQLDLGVLDQAQVRIVWLVSGREKAEGEKPAKPPADLAEVVAELGKLGIDKPELVAQGIVNASLNASFRLEGSANLHTPCKLSISGMLMAKKQHPSLEIEIKAAADALPQPAGRGFAPGVNQICNLKTHITTPLGHPVVLGVTPTEGMTSVFVVQVLRKEPKAEPKKGRPATP